MEEIAEDNADLIAFLSSWLAAALELDDRVGPVITQAFRIEAKNNPRRKYPRDIIIMLADMRVRQAILNAARQNGGLKLQDQLISVFLDIASEAIAKKRELKQILGDLRDAGIRHRWITPVRL